MKKEFKKVLSLLLGVLMVGTLAACGAEEPVESKEVTETNEEVAESKEEVAGEETGSTVPMVVGYLQFNEKFSPFFAEVAYDQDTADLTQVSLLTTDRTGGIILNAIEGETVPYNGTDYAYNGIADITITQDEEANKTVYNFKLREDITFSDGKPLTADDVIFTYYVNADTDYDGSATLYSQPILGLKNYRANSTAADSVTAEDVEKVIADMPEALATSISETIITPVLEGEKVWCTEYFEDYKSDEITTVEEFYVSAYSIDEDYVAGDKDIDTIVADVIEMYGTDYISLGGAYAADEAHFAGDVFALAEAYRIEELKAGGEGEEVPNIEGIKKLGDYEFEVTSEGYDATIIYQLCVTVAPLHYYGSEDLYDYENNSFGFTRGDLSIVRENTTTPMGAGPYKFLKYENNTVYLEANETYYKGAPVTKDLQLKASAEADKVAGVDQGTIDITDPPGSKPVFEQIATINGNDSTTGEKIITNTVDYLGYGYIGINAETVNVAGIPDSDESKNLRKGLATVLSVFRDVAIDSYYGDAASVINYPISNTSWAAPQKSDGDYEVAFSVDVEGNAIYTEDMAAEDKYAASLETALGYFEAAGYTVADGKLTAAPEGAKLSYEIIIPADGAGDHPSFAILADAKTAFETIGFELNINDPSDSNVLWDALNAKTQELWTAAWGATIDPDMYQIYHSDATNSNHYSIKDEKLDQLIMDARSSDDQTYRKSVYKECLDIIADWGVEVPVYQRQDCIIYSPERVNAETFTPDITTFYTWLKEVENVAMN